VFAPDYVCVLGNEDFVYYVNPFLVKHFDLGEELANVNDAARTDDAFHAEENPGRDVMSNKLLPIMVDGVPGVAASVIADTVCIIPIFQKVMSNLSLSLIAVLNANDDIYF
jgi:hypothetical protein